MGKIKEGLYKYQRENFQPLCHKIRDFDDNAYPETASKYHLEKMAEYMGLEPRKAFEPIECYRAGILDELAAEGLQEAEDNAVLQTRLQ